MFGTGLLVLTAPINQLSNRIAPILLHAVGKVDQVLYIQLQPNNLIASTCSSATAADEQHTRFHRLNPTNDLCTTMTRLYTRVASLCNRLDVRILQGNVGKENDPLVHPYGLQHNIEVILTDCLTQNREDFRGLMEANFTFDPYPKVEFLSESDWQQTNDNKSISSDWRLPKSEELKTYGHVVLGGTFDTLHAGHKILLSESAMRSERKITVGVTTGEMLASKTLSELIEPVENRITYVRDFIRDIKPHILFDDSVVPITDPFGPSIVVPDMGGIVVSEETRKGGDAVNKRRQQKGLNQLDIHVIELLEDTCHASHEETKISSSSRRIRMLGKLLRSPCNMPTSGTETPYVIGLTGGIASSKSSVCKRLESLGARIINCDKLGHKAYEPGTKAYGQVIEEFGKDIVGEDGSINRKALGGKVFVDKSRLGVLNGIVWPEIARMAREQIQHMASQQGHSVCVLDAAVLLEAGWQEFVHEIWVCVIPKAEALKRIQDRDGIPEDRARLRIESQLSNQTRVDKANIVLCTLWESDVTQKQVESAWSLLQERILSTKSQQPKL